MYKFRMQNEPTSIENIEALETELGCHLPEDYRQFLQTVNGGIPENLIVVFGDDLDDTISILSGVGEDSRVNIAERMRQLGSQYPAGLIEIGVTAGGNRLLLSVHDDCYGQVFHFDHEVETCPHFFPSLNIFPPNITKISDSFTEFLDSLIHEDDV